MNSGLFYDEPEIEPGLIAQPWFSQGLLPHPRRVEPGNEVLGVVGRLDPLNSYGGRLDRAIGRLNARLAQLAGRAQPGRSLALPLRIDLHQSLDTAVDDHPNVVNDERYRLIVTREQVHLEAASTWGAMAALETLAQCASHQGELRSATIQDLPCYPWRGVLLDPARRFLPIAALERTIDAMAAMKLNVLHLHLTDDQGFRFPSLRWPRFVSRPAYDRSELRALIEYAADRGVRIVPELDMPGHVTSWLVAYPALGLEAVEPSARFGVHRGALNPCSDLTYRVVEDLLDEVCALFPDPCIHIGGDEVHPDAWRLHPEVQAFAARENVADMAALQAQFTHRVAQAVLARGRTPVVWDEALHPVLEPLGEQLIVEAWRGATARDRVLAAGHRCVFASGYYLDLNYPARWHYAFDPRAPQRQLIEHEDSLLQQSAFAGVADGMRWTHQWRNGAHGGLPPDDPAFARLLGGEACLWGELVDDPVLDQRLWSRLPLIAERFWRQGTADSDTLYERLLLAHRYLEDVGLISLEADLESQLARLEVPLAWRWLIDWLEPVKWYARLLGADALAARLSGTEMPQARPYDATTALGKLVDVLPPESLATRQSLEPLLANHAQPEALSSLLSGWADLLAASECPPLLRPYARILGELTRVMRTALDDGSTVDPQALEPLLEPVHDIVVAPVAAVLAQVRTDRDQTSR
ncbi:MAG: family 20 glycosylhydrolase [Pseudomonadota bacterium]